MVRLSPATLAAALVLLSLSTALGLGGAAPFGRLALALGLPGLAAPLLEDPFLKGVAFYRQERFEEAVAAFRAAGRAAFYDRGNALARIGRYQEAVALYDAALFYAPGDEDARVNRALVDALIEREDGERRAGGSIATEGEARTATADSGAAADDLLAAFQKARRNYVGTRFSDQGIVASPEWLATLADEPGRYLKLRLAAEQRRRRALGTAAPPGDDPW